MKSYYNYENAKKEETDMAPTTTNENRNVNSSSSTSSTTNNGFTQNGIRYVREIKSFSDNLYDFFW